MNIDMRIELNEEDRLVRAWEKEERNRILRMSNPKKKQVEWNLLFPKLEVSNIPY